MVDVERIARRARRAAELGRLRSAARLPLLALPLVVFFSIFVVTTAECCCVGALALGLATLLGWHGRGDRIAASIGTSCGAVVLMAAAIVTRVSPAWRCGPGTRACDLFVVACLLAAAGLTVKRDRVETGALRTPRRLAIAGLISGSIGSLTCWNGGFATLAAPLAAGAAATLVAFYRMPLAAR